MKLSLSSEEYRFNHGANPRGRGSWAFVFREGSCRPDNYTNDEIWWAPGSTTFGEAVNVAKVEARRRFPGAHIVTIGVCS